MLQTSVYSRELFQLNQQRNQLNYRISKATDPGTQAHLKMRLEGIIRTQHYIKHLHITTYEKKMAMVRIQKQQAEKTKTAPPPAIAQPVEPVKRTRTKSRLAQTSGDSCIETQSTGLIVQSKVIDAVPT